MQVMSSPDNHWPRKGIRPRKGIPMHNLCLVLIMIVAVTLPLGCSKAPENKPKPPPIKVETATVKRGDLAKRLHVSGPLRFIANTTVSAEVTAQVKSIHVSDGQNVNEGQLLIVFDDTKIRETLVHAGFTLQKDEATLALNKKDYERNLSLFEKKSVSQTVLDQKFSAYKNSVAQVEMDRAVYAKAIQDLKNTRVRSPITGWISKRYVERGDWVDEGGKLFQISDFRKVYLRAYLSDLDLAKLDLEKVRDGGVPTTVEVDSYPGKIFHGKLSYVEPVANEARLFEARTFLENKDMLLLQGMFGRGKVAVGNARDVLKIPLAALLGQLRDNHENRVFVVDSHNSALLKKIIIGKSNRIYAQVIEGLEEGDVVVVRGKEVLTTGQQVQPSPRTDYN